MTIGSEAIEQLVHVEFPPHDPTLLDAQADLRAEYDALGIVVRIESNREEVLAAADLSFGPRRMAPSSAGETEFLVRLLAHQVHEEPGWQPRQPLIREQEHQLFISASRATVVAGDLSRHRCFGFLSPEAVSQPEFLRSGIVQTPVYRYITRTTMAGVHSATLARNGRTVMLRGKAGAGKSTLAYAAIRAGFSLIAEDVAYVRRGASGFELLGLPWLMYLVPDAARFFPEIAELPQVYRLNGEAKSMLDMRRYYPNQSLGCGPLGPIVFVERAQDATAALIPVEPADAVQLLDATAVSAERNDQHIEVVWSAFLEQPIYRLQVGTDFDQAVEVLDQIVSG
jgi:hypothetical protein